MAIDPTGAVAALNRFGLGARPGDLAAAAGDPHGFLLEELRAPDVALPPSQLPGAAAALQRVYLDQQQKRMAREHAAMAPPEASPSPVVKREPPPEQMLFRDEAMARYAKQFAASAGFVERLVAFWSNHFAVSVAKGAHLRVTAGPFEREAIRPHVLGKFRDMLLAVARHPAMILYLDNQRSIGPDAAPGRFAGRGLNENLAREILELHTLGADGGYGQADVSAFARILTGWSVAEVESEAGEPGAFIFKANWHEPGAQALLGKSYAQPGAAQGEAALRDLAAHPRTAKHIAVKFARHFIADAPPADLVEKLAKSFLASDGDLRLLAATLLADERAFRAPATKLRAPQEFVIAAARASGFLPHEPGPLLHLANTLGQPLWQPAGPNGFSDAADVWGAPEAMKTRLDVSLAMAQRLRDAAPPLALLDVIAGVAASHDTRQAVERAESRQQALAILFMSPEFQRR